ncbi:MAG TPA: hypothetical protein VGO93_29590 [Candidatus Xenobia bacterium]|jgi:hypothetical protein
MRAALDQDFYPTTIDTPPSEAMVRETFRQAQRDWLRETWRKAKTVVAPLGRLVDDNSPCCDNFHVQTDLADFHQYYSIPDAADRWDAWTADMASRPAFLFSPYGDAHTTGEEPLVVSEFGNWGLPFLYPPLPWWADHVFHGRAITHMAGVLERFHQVGLDRAFASYNAFAHATQDHQTLSFAMKSRPCDPTRKSRASAK